MRYRSLIVALALTAAACSPAAEDPPAGAKGPAPPTSRQGLLAEDIEAAALSGELGCAFAEAEAREPLLVAMADVRDDARAEGVLRIAGSAVRLRAAEAGGFNALLDGARFTGSEVTATVTVTSTEAIGGGESPPRAALLVVESAAAAPDRIAGQWACGP